MISKKVVLLGHFGVGKTSLIRRFVENVFTEDYKVSIGVHILKKSVEIPEEKKDVSLILWDLEGSDDIVSFRKSYLLGAHAFIYVFDLTRPSTYINLNNDVAYLADNYKMAHIQTVGNKADLVDPYNIKEILNDNQIQCDYQTSAKTGDNVETMFTYLAKELIV
ncbi:MAG: GTP-binding protein [Flavobacteriaceae bacterium]|nr:GTP-binding protein [Flavobacteriaceae bacterium]